MLLLAVSVFSGCSQGPIFADIEKEVPLVGATMVGSVHSMVEYKGSLYSTNGYVYRKTGNGGWDALSIPAGKRCVQLASGDMLYGLFTHIDDPYAFSMEYYNGAEWTVIIGRTFMVQTIFDNGAGIAYAVASESGKYALRLLSSGEMSGVGEYSKPFFDAVVLKGTTYLVAEDGIYAESNPETLAISGMSGIVGAAVSDDRNTLYAVSSTGTLYYSTDGASAVKANVDVGSAVCVEYNGYTSILLVGTVAGYRQVSVGSDGKPGGIVEHVGNADPAIGSYRVDQMYVLPAPPESTDTYIIYASIFDRTDAKRSGLWSYRNGSWNRE